MQWESSRRQQAGILQSRNDNQGGEAKKCLVFPNCGKGGQNYCSGSLNHGRVHILLCLLVFLAVFFGNKSLYTHAVAAVAKGCFCFYSIVFGSNILFYISTRCRMEHRLTGNLIAVLQIAKLQHSLSLQNLIF